MAFTFKLLSSTVLISSLILAGCDSNAPTQTSLPNDNEQTISKGPGSFGVSLLKGLSKQSAKTTVQTDPVVSFDLGCIKGSTAFYFIVFNVGKGPITNITFTVDDSSFSVFPSKIDTLIPGTDVNIVPIIKTVAFHGTPIEGAGNRPLMKQGLNDAMVTISGTTKTINGVDTTVTLSAKLQLTALVMDLQIRSSFGGPYKLPVVSTGRTELHFPDGNYYNFSSGLGLNYQDSIVTLKNTGNVVLSYKIYKSDDSKWNGYTVALQDSLIGTLKDGDSLIVPHKYIPGVDQTLEHFFFISGNNTTYDPKKLPVRDDGVIYFTTHQYMPSNN
jgi:hypothetical protein